ncbi:MAG: FAD-dependent oxidoreductase [Proteobacteria bacterium]|nr:FAD-dependent oxidoreductase [Pseudomonadota bacterium]
MTDTHTAAGPLRIAIVGSGPSGFYAAEALFDALPNVEVDMLERYPVPYGLVRLGVAPDHAKLKSVIAQFEQIARRPGFRFCGNVALGRDVSPASLASMYHAVVLATGVNGDRTLGIPGETLRGVHAAADFVGWYNGRPECRALEFDLRQESVAIVGQGNVAIDVCRLLASPLDKLARTDITAHALDALANSRVREIHLVGRRGPAQAKFTPKELRELGQLPGWQPVVDPADLELGEACRAEAADPANPFIAKNLQILRCFADAPRRKGDRSIYLHFLRAPVAAKGEGRLQALELRRQRLVGVAGQQRAVDVDGSGRLDVGLLFRSVGYRGIAMEGLPFDVARCVVPNEQGRVKDCEGRHLPGWYVTGWIKRGPSGVIGTNRQDSVETVQSMLADMPGWIAPPRRDSDALRDQLDARAHRVVAFDDWLAIEREERENGHHRGKVAEKFVDETAMLAAVENARGMRQEERV